MRASEIPKQIANWEEETGVSIYVTLAKAVLWVVSIALVGVVFGCSYLVVFTQDAAQISNVVGACQALVVVSLSILGFRNYTGSKLFYTLRHGFSTAEHIKDGGKE